MKGMREAVCPAGDILPFSLPLPIREHITESATESIRESVSACRRNKKLFACNREVYALSKGLVARL